MCDVDLHIIAVQVTVVPPGEHSSSLQFYSTDRDGIADCDRYKQDNENAIHHFVWIVPEEQNVLTSGFPPGPQSMRPVEQHLCTIEEILDT